LKNILLDTGDARGIEKKGEDTDTGEETSLNATMTDVSRDSAMPIPLCLVCFQAEEFLFNPPSTLPRKITGSSAGLSFSNLCVIHHRLIPKISRQPITQTRLRIPRKQHTVDLRLDEELRGDAGEVALVVVPIIEVSTRPIAWYGS